MCTSSDSDTAPPRGPDTENNRLQRQVFWSDRQIKSCRFTVFLNMIKKKRKPSAEIKPQKILFNSSLCLWVFLRVTNVK